MLKFFDELSLGDQNLGQIVVQGFILWPAFLLELVEINLIHLPM